jgi:hypothetical protein
MEELAMSFTNLFIGYNEEEDFRILICAWDKEQAQELANEYGFDSNLDGKFEIKEVESGIDNIHSDCDYIIA